MIENIPLALSATLFSIFTIRFLIAKWHQNDLIAPDSVYSALVLMHFFVPAILYSAEIGPKFVARENEDFLLQATVYAFVCLTFLQVGSLYYSKIFNPNQWLTTRRSTREWSGSGLILGVFFLEVAGWLARFYIVSSNAYFQTARTSIGEINETFFAAVMMIELFPLYAICAVAIWSFRPSRLSGRGLMFGLLAILIVLELAYWVPSGRKEPVILTLLLPSIIKYIRTGAMPAGRTVVVIAVAIASLFPLAFLYRGGLELPVDASDSIGALLGAWNQSAGNSAIDVKTSDVTLSRISLLEPLAACIRLVNDRIVELRLGNDYADALLGLIPRFLWADKPNLHYGNDFGYLSGIIFAGDSLTSISVSFFGEGFLNFSWFGAGVFFLIGIAFNVIYQQHRSGARTETWIFVYAVTLPTIMYVGGTFALYFGGLIKLIPFAYLLGRMMEGKRDRHQNLTRLPNDSVVLTYDLGTK